MRTTALIAVVLLSLLALAATAAGQLATGLVSGDQSGAAVQIQVIGNSDSAADQALKLQVRDAVIASVGPRLRGLEGEAGRAVLAASLGELEAVAGATVTRAGFAYDVTVELGSFHHDGRQYGPIVAAAGEHDLLRISIGEASGANWWCVLLPPVCFARSEGGIAVLSEEDVTALLQLDEHGKWVLPADAAASLESAPPRLRIAVLEWLRQFDGREQLARWPRWLAQPWFGTVAGFPS